MENNFELDTRPERPAHVSTTPSAYDPYHFDDDNHKFASIWAIGIFLFGIAAIIAFVVL